MNIRRFYSKELSISIDTYIDKKHIIWLRGRDVARSLGYTNTSQAILAHVDEDDKIRRLVPQKPLSENQTMVSEPLKPLSENQIMVSEPLKPSSENQTMVSEPSKPTSKSKVVKAPKDKETSSVSGYKSKAIFINESGLYSLIFGSKLVKAKAFKGWVTREVLPSIRKYGRYRLFNNPYNNAFKIENETDLHYKVINFIQSYYPDCLLAPGLGENQDTQIKRIDSKRKGYMRGQPDITIQNLHKHYSGMVIELKTPMGTGDLSNPQEMLLFRYRSNGYKVLVSSNYDECITEIIEYMRHTRINCPLCIRRFKNTGTMRNHLLWVHKTDKIYTSIS